MLDFDLGTQTVITQPTTVSVVDVISFVEETVTVKPVASQSAAFVLKDEKIWGWSDLRDYVIREIEQRHGPQVRNPITEASIFKGFMSRWPEQSVAIAKVAFGPVHEGMWQNAPISVNRFCKASDPFFASVIAHRI